MMNGLYLIKPTSIVSTGTGNSSSINTNGSVTFSTCATLSLNGVFSTDYDNYMVVMRGSAASATYVHARLRASGTDDSGTNYTRQYLAVDGTAVSSARVTSATALELGYSYGDIYGLRYGIICHLYGPYLAQPTATRSVVAADYLNGYIHDTACTHSLSTTYDAITFFNFNAGGLLTGRVAVYGMVK